MCARRNENDEFVSRVATLLKWARALIEAGFEYVTEKDDYKLSEAKVSAELKK